VETVFSKLGSEVKLECEGSDISWKFKANESIIEFENLEAKDEKISMEKGMLQINELEQQDIGVYACFNSDGPVKQFSVEVPFRMKKMAASLSVDLGSDVNSLHCIVLGHHEVAVRWFKQPEGSDKDEDLSAICGVENDGCRTGEPEADILNIPQVEEVKEREDKTTTAKPFTERLSISLEQGEGMVTSTISIDNVQVEDRALYVCRATAIEKTVDDEVCGEDDHFCVEGRTLLRVKDPYAAIWPFAGIVLEVVILCLVIFICERRKKDDDRDDDDNDRYAGNNAASNNSLRQRK